MAGGSRNWWICFRLVVVWELSKCTHELRVTRRKREREKMGTKCSSSSVVGCPLQLNTKQTTYLPLPFWLTNSFFRYFCVWRKLKKGEREKFERHVFALEKVHFFLNWWVARVNLPAMLTVYARPSQPRVQVCRVPVWHLWLTCWHPQNKGTPALGTPETLYKHFGCSIIF